MPRKERDKAQPDSARRPRKDRKPTRTARVIVDRVDHVAYYDDGSDDDEEFALHSPIYSQRRRRKASTVDFTSDRNTWCLPALICCGLAAVLNVLALLTVIVAPDAPAIRFVTSMYQGIRRSHSTKTSTETNTSTVKAPASSSLKQILHPPPTPLHSPHPMPPSPPPSPPPPSPHPPNPHVPPPSPPPPPPSPDVARFLNARFSRGSTSNNLDSAGVWVYQETDRNGPVDQLMGGTQAGQIEGAIINKQVPYLPSSRFAPGVVLSSSNHIFCTYWERSSEECKANRRIQPYWCETTDTLDDSTDIFDCAFKGSGLVKQHR